MYTFFFLYSTDDGLGTYRIVLLSNVSYILVANIKKIKIN